MKKIAFMTIFSYEFKAKHSGKCLDVAGAGMGNGANVHQWDCRGGDNPLWRLK